MDFHLGTTLKVRIVWCSALSVVNKVTQRPTEEDIVNVESTWDSVRSFDKSTIVGHTFVGALMEL